MPARDDSYEYISGRGGEYPYYDQRDDFEYNGYAGGAKDRRAAMQNDANGVQNRGGPQIDNSQATSDLGRAISARGDQQYLAGYLQSIANGTAMSPAQQQLLTQNQAAVNAQRGLARSATGFGAVAGADRNAQMAASQMGMQGRQALGIQRANDMTMARDQYGNVVDAMRGQDIQGGGLLYDQAYNQAQLDDAQRARNDAMAQFYSQQRYNIGSEQLGANADYERQRYEDASHQSNLDWANQTSRDDQNRAQQAAAFQGMGQALSVGIQSASSDDDQDRRRNPDGGA